MTVDDLGKVIYSIERCICHVPDACRDCAYDAGHPYNECVEMLLRDAMELLKAQEPRLLMEREIMDAENIDVYLEEACETQTHPLRLVETESESRHKVAFFWPSVVRPLNTYGIAWRCWTGKPTVEQRKAVPWG